MYCGISLVGKGWKFCRDDAKKKAEEFADNHSQPPVKYTYVPRKGKQPVSGTYFIEIEYKYTQEGERWHWRVKSGIEVIAENTEFSKRDAKERAEMFADNHASNNDGLIMYEYKPNVQ